MQGKFQTGWMFALCLLVGAGVALWGTAAWGGAKVKPGESIVKFDSDKMGDAGPAEFSHPAHKAAFGAEKLDCKPCHMAKPVVFKMAPKRKAGELRATMDDMKQGKSCGHCHNGKTEMNGKVAFDAGAEEDCAKCHKK